MRFGASKPLVQLQTIASVSDLKPHWKHGLAWASVCCTSWVSQGRRDQCSIVKCRLSRLHRLLWAPQQGPWEEKNYQFWGREQEVHLFWKPMLPTSSYRNEVGRSWSQRVSDKHINAAVQAERGGGRGETVPVRSPFLTQILPRCGEERSQQAGQGQAEVTGWIWEPLST